MTRLLSFGVLLLPALAWADAEIAEDATPEMARVEGQVFAGYIYKNADAVEQNEFELGRSEVGLWLLPEQQFGGELRLEAIRSAGRESVTGVDGDSLVLRVKRAWGYARTKAGPVALEARFGLIPDPWIESIESVYDFRDVGPTLGERSFFYDTSDLGMSVVAQAFRRRLTLVGTVQNGEGRNQIEQNNGKNLSLVLRAKAFELDDKSHLTFLVSGRNGSVGPAAVRAHRLSAAVAWTSPTINTGFEYSRALGLGAESGRKAAAYGGWLTGYVPRWQVGAFGRADVLDQNTSLSDDEQMQFSAGIFLDALPPSYTDTAIPRPDRRVRLYLLGQVDRFGDNAAPIVGVPGAADAVGFLAILSLQGGNAVP